MDKYQSFINDYPLIMIVSIVIHYWLITILIRQRIACCAGQPSVLRPQSPESPHHGGGAEGAGIHVFSLSGGWDLG